MNDVKFTSVAISKAEGDNHIAAVDLKGGLYLWGANNQG